MKALEINKIYNVDCFDEIKGMGNIPDNSIDLIICDLPYNMTSASWDCKIDLDKLWEEYKRILKYNHYIVLFAVQPFTTDLISSNREQYYYSWYWNKKRPTGFQYAKHQPMRVVEEVLVFLNNGDIEKDNPILQYFKSELEKSGLTRTELKKKMGNDSERHFLSVSQFHLPTEENYALLQKVTGRYKKPYQTLKREYENLLGKFNYNSGAKFNKIKFGNTYAKTRELYNSNFDKEHKSYTGYPTNLLTFCKEFDTIHPTQKPLELVKYLINLYTNEGDIVLDNCIGSGTTAVACIDTNRNFIGFELDKGYYKQAEKRIKSFLKNKER